MKRAVVLVFLISFLIAGTEVCSQEPPPPSTEGQPRIFNPKASTQRDIKPKYGYDITVNTMSSPDKMKAGKTNNPAENNENKNNDGQPPAVKDDPITRYTFWLMIFTACLAVCNIALWFYTKAAAEAAKQAANAAELGARAAIRMELPVIKAGPVRLLAAPALTDEPWGLSLGNQLPTKFSVFFYESV